VAAFGVFCILLSRLSTALAHESGAPFSGAIIEPLRVHHAHIEDEQRLNSAFLSSFRAEDKTRTAFANSLELAVAWNDDFSLGSEILVPFSNTGDDRSDYSIGDIELWPLKYAFVNSPATILTGVLSFTLPSGDESKGLGEGSAAAGPLLFVDHAYGNWFVGMNAELETAMSGPGATEAELAAVLSYSFISETAEGGVAPTRPHQFLVPSLSFETIFESALAGEEKGESVVSVIPGAHLWHPASGWIVRLGVEVPLSADKPADYALLFQFGNHFDWGVLFR